MLLEQILQQQDVISHLKTQFVRLTLSLSAKRYESQTDKNTLDVIRREINKLIDHPSTLDELRQYWAAQIATHHHPGLFKSKQAYRNWEKYHAGKSIAYTWLLNQTKPFTRQVTEGIDINKRTKAKALQHRQILAPTNADILPYLSQDQEFDVANKMSPEELRQKFPGAKMTSKPLGRGWEAAVFPHKTHSNVVTKVVNRAGSSTLDFLQTILDNQDNIFFPRIYNLKRYKNGRSTAIIYQTERLIPLDHPRVNHLWGHLIKQLGVSDLAVNMPDMLNDAFATRDGRRELVKKSNNDQFKQAMKALEHLFLHHQSDMHEGNLMIRLTGSGPQLVIIDPLLPSSF